MKEIRFGIIGCGLMGREFASAAARWLHLTNTKAKPRIVAVCDTNPALMDWFSGHLGPIQTTTDYHALLANPDIDAVYCAVPHVLHEQLYPDILAAGKHLFGENPSEWTCRRTARSWLPLPRILNWWCAVPRKCPSTPARKR